MNADWWDGSSETITTSPAMVHVPAMAKSSRGTDNPVENPLVQFSMLLPWGLTPTGCPGLHGS